MFFPKLTRPALKLQKPFFKRTGRSPHSTELWCEGRNSTKYCLELKNIRSCTSTSANALRVTKLPVSISEVIKIRGMCERTECELQVDVSVMGVMVFFPGWLIFHTCLRESGSAHCTNILYTFMFIVVYFSQNFLCFKFFQNALISTVVQQCAFCCLSCS